MSEENQNFTSFNDPMLQSKVMELIGGEGNNPQETPQGGENSNPQPSTTPQGAEGQGQETPQGAENPTQQAPQPQEQLLNGQMVTPQDGQQLILGKFKSPEEVLNAYQNLESFNTKTRQELANMKSQMDALSQENQMLKQGGQQAPPQIGESVSEVDNEEFMNSFYENPQQVIQNAIKQAIEQTVKPQIAPIQEKFEYEQKQADWNNRIKGFAAQTPDFDDHLPIMADLLDQNPDLADHPNGLNIVYMMAKGHNSKPNVDPRAYLQDENFVNENILKNEDIKNKIVQDYLKSVKQNNDNSPITINSNGTSQSGEIPFTAENKPKSMAEASDMVRKLFGI